MALTTVEDVAAMLRWGAAENTRFASDLAAYVAAASEIVESDAGPFEQRTVEHIADGAKSILLPYRVSAVESVAVKTDADGYEWVDGYYVPGGGWSALDGWAVNLRAGIVHSLYGGFPAGRQNIKVTFTTGFETVPEAAKLAATMVAADKWAIASQRAPGFDDQVDPVYLMPRAVRDLLAPFKATTMPGFA